MSFTRNTRIHPDAIIPVSFAVGSFGWLVADQAAAAYSLRYIVTGYTGDVIEVRRASDNATSGFTPTEITDGTLTTFCSGTDGLVTTWYDQTGNSRHMTQSNPSLQPYIHLTATGLRTSNGLPSVMSDGDYLKYSSGIFSGASKRTVTCVYAPLTTAVWVYPFVSQAGGVDVGRWTSIQARSSGATGDPYFAGFAQDIGNGKAAITTDQKLAFFNYDGSNGYLYKNNTLLETKGLLLAAVQTDPLYLFYDNLSGRGDLQEAILWTSDQSDNRHTISNNINAYYNIY